MTIDNVLASVAVMDLAAAIEWYRRLLGKPSSRPMPTVAEWRFDRGGWLQVYELPQRAGNGSFTLVVSDLDAEAERLAVLGIAIDRRSDSPSVRTLMIRDPDGNHIALAQALDPSLAR